MTVVEWLRFIQARSQVDQEWMQAVMTRVLPRARWMDKVCQGMFFGWKMAYDRHRGTERRLEAATRSLDGAPTMIDSYCWSSEASPKGCRTRWLRTSRGSRIS